jgi:hypothetical protein
MSYLIFKAVFLPAIFFDLGIDVLHEGVPLHQHVCEGGAGEDSHHLSSHELIYILVFLLFSNLLKNRGMDGYFRGMDDQVRGMDGYYRGLNGQVRGKDGYFRGMNGHVRGMDGYFRGMNGQVRGMDG